MRYQEISQWLFNKCINLRAEWDEWNGEETRQQDQEGQEEIFHDPAEQSTMIVPTEESG